MAPKNIISICRMNNITKELKGFSGVSTRICSRFLFSFSFFFGVLWKGRKGMLYEYAAEKIGFVNYSYK